MGIHLLALPLWLVQALLWDFPAARTAGQAAHRGMLIAAYAAIVLGAYVALAVALIVWWRQGRRRLFLSPMVAGLLALVPCLLVFLFSRRVRRALVPPPMPAPSP